ncbi:class I SAM-dependent methyltransferase [Nonomuraea endophytica]|uniref:class I SAM-dependent methyltransferase n=1 Tax=Nonomuraea endophytica TaxID=714136 RepID=UPI0037C57002
MDSRHLYNLGYRLARMPWEIGPRAELVELVRSGRLAPGRAVDLGCGTGANAIFLARHGFEVTGLDFASAALAKARRNADRAGAGVRFVEDDLTRLRQDHGDFDVLVDYGTLDDLSPAGRDRYVANVVPLARPGARFLLWCFEWTPRRWERLRPMAPGEVRERFGGHFAVERLTRTTVTGRWRLIPGHAAYLMTRHDEVNLP